MNIDIELKETPTMTLMFIPGVIIAHDSEDQAFHVQSNNEYMALKQSKIGSDMYTIRGS
jgi:hypothetical protein